MLSHYNQLVGGERIFILEGLELCELALEDMSTRLGKEMFSADTKRFEFFLNIGMVAELLNSPTGAIHFGIGIVLCVYHMTEIFTRRVAARGKKCEQNHCSTYQHNHLIPL